MKPLQSLITTCAVLLLVTVACAGPQLFPSATPGSLLGTPAPTSPEVTALITEGQTAYQRGDLDGARKAFDMAYSMDTRNVIVIGFLRRIKVDELSKPKKIDRERQLAAVIIPQIQFREATLGSALDFVKRAVDKQTGGKVGVSFVVQLPAEQVNAGSLTLSLSNIPATEALRYLADLANATVSYENYAVVLKPKPSAVVPTASSTAPPPAQ